MIAYRHRHPVIRKRLPKAVCGMDPVHAHNVNAEILNLPPDARTLAVCFAGYDRERGHDDIVYLALNTYWKDVEIRLPDLHSRGCWYLSVNTYGDGQNRYFYPEGQETRIDGSFIMRPRSVAVFTARKM